MEPRLRFARTEDGLAIAFWAQGEGAPIVHLPWQPWSHVQLEWQNPEMQRWYAALSADSMLIRYDGRGTGLSDRDPAELGIEAQVRDIQAVVDALELERFALLGVYNSGPAALLYAARHPERVAGLVLWCTYAASEDYYASPRVASIRDLINDWELYTETGAHAFVGWASGEAAHELALMMREAVTPEITRRFFAEMRDVDCRDCLPIIKAPTLVLHPRRFPLIDIDLARQIAARIPGARLLPLEGDSMAPGHSNLTAAVEAIRELLRPSTTDGATAALPEADVVTDRSKVTSLGLTRRELEILRLLALGKNNREIAEELVLSPRTVERHVANIYGKVNISNRAQATAFAISNGLVA